jgi:hypothetical protein
MVFALTSGQFYFDKKLRAVYRDSAILTTDGAKTHACPDIVVN